jgi:hypothetical protein
MSTSHSHAPWATTEPVELLDEPIPVKDRLKSMQIPVGTATMEPNQRHALDEFMELMKRAEEGRP